MHTFCVCRPTCICMYNFCLCCKILPGMFINVGDHIDMYIYVKLNPVNHFVDCAPSVFARAYLFLNLI